MSSILIRRANMVVAGSSPTPGRLPAGYTELAYLETDGNCYIDTGYTLRASKDDVEIDFYLPSTATMRPFGARNTTSSKVYALNTQNGNFRFGWNNATVTASAAPAGRHVAKIEHSGGILKIDGETSYTAGDASITTAYNAYIFAINTSTVAASASGLRIYSFKLWREGDLSRDLVPAMHESDSVVGMYDLVSNTFLTNAGSGTFSYGTL